MLKRSRVSGAMDAGRLAQLVRGPGIDTRTWISLAIALGDSVVEGATGGQSGGVFVDVMLMPTGEHYTARVGADYQGDGYGFYFGKIHADDELLVAAPSGDPAQGIVVTTKLSSAAEPPSDDAVNNPDDVSLVVEKDHSLRLTVQGEGQVFISTGGGNATIDTAGGSVFLGENATDSENTLSMDGVVNGQGIDPFTGATYFALTNASSKVFAKKE